MAVARRNASVTRALTSATPDKRSNTSASALTLPPRHAFFHRGEEGLVLLRVGIQNAHDLFQVRLGHIEDILISIEPAGAAPVVTFIA